MKNLINNLPLTKEEKERLTLFLINVNLDNKERTKLLNMLNDFLSEKTAEVINNNSASGMF